MKRKAVLSQKERKLCDRASDFLDSALGCCREAVNRISWKMMGTDELPLRQGQKPVWSIHDPPGTYGWS